jgi:hypothetical protein
MKRNHRVNNATLPPLTPQIPAPTPVSRPTVAPDTRIEKILFEMYLFEKDRADASTRLYHEEVKKKRKVEELFKRYKMRGLAKKLFPSHNEATQ